MTTVARFFLPLVTLCLLLGGNTCLAFGADGHRIVVLIAQAHISDKTSATINGIIDNDDLSELSLWPDRIRYIPKWQQSKYWHYVSIDDDERFADFKRHSDGDVISALEYFYAQLHNPELSKRQRWEALSFFSHFVADIHQPLHVGRRADRGGNTIRVKWPDQPRGANLHQLWDSLILNTENKTPRQYSHYLNQTKTRQHSAGRQTDFVLWARESKALRPQVYDFPQPKYNRAIITASYIERSKAIIEQRLLIAGLRLAECLNLIFDPEGRE